MTVRAPRNLSNSAIRSEIAAARIQSFDRSGVANDPSTLAPIRLLAPHRPEFRLRLYPHLPSGGSSPGFAFPVSRPFVGECHIIPAIPALWTIPGLPELLTLFPAVSPAHTLVRRSGTQ